MSLAPASLPPGQRVYAIGDVHGCADRLRALHDAIRADLQDRPIADPTVIHLGDYVDRGDDSAGVLALLVRGWSDQGGRAPRLINLTGNHEAMLLAALDPADHDAAVHWLSNGAAPTLASWGLHPSDGPAHWRTRIPPEQLGLLRSLPMFHRQGGYIFVHAGLRPGVSLERQSDEDMLWIREPFLSFSGALPAVVVHGHTPARTATVRTNRIGIDTGAVMGGALTAVMLEADRLAFLQA